MDWTGSRPTSQLGSRQMGVMVRNSSAATDEAPVIPLRPDGSFYRFEMIADGGWSRFYDDSPAGLLDFLIPGYLDLNDQERIAARIRHSIDLQVRLQARLNTFFDKTRRTPEENAILLGPRHVQPEVDEWFSQIPLVLVDVFYAPFTDVPRPVSGFGDTALTPNLWWLRPGESEMGYLESLHAAGLIDLHAAADEVV